MTSTVYVGNHVSYLDVPALGISVDGVFIAKKDVGRWPLFGLLASISRTIFVSRQRQNVKAETKILADRIANGQSLILFPEGTSSDGTKVRPFHAGLLSAAWLSSPQDTFVQPFSIVYGQFDSDRTLSTWQDRDHFAWYGKMEFWPHLWRLFACGKRATVTLVFHSPISVAEFSNPRELARWSQNIITNAVASQTTGTDQHFHSRYTPSRPRPVCKSS